MHTTIKDILVLLRPQQYVKNLFIFLPLFFGMKLLNFDAFLQTVLAFVSFSLIASAVYVFNDYHDMETDKKHPSRKNRPFASGKVSKKAAFFLIPILLIIGFATSTALDPKASILITTYFLTNLAYTLKLKHIPIIDTMIVSIGFILRLFVGAFVANVPLSIWIILITFLLSLFMALSKRRADLITFLDKRRKSGNAIDGYSVGFLDSSMIIMASAIIVAYIMYTISTEVVTRIQNGNLYFTLIWVLLGILRYLQITFVENGSGSPTDILLKDRFIQISVLGWIITWGWFLYL